MDLILEPKLPINELSSRNLLSSEREEIRFDFKLDMDAAIEL
jgi:hypothetical protein